LPILAFEQTTQKKVDADHFFNDKDALLIDEVSTWLK
jgi:alpha/beta superfamily hydrolase